MFTYADHHPTTWVFGDIIYRWNASTLSTKQRDQINLFINVHMGALYAQLLIALFFIRTACVSIV